MMSNTFDWVGLNIASLFTIEIQGINKTEWCSIQTFHVFDMKILNTYNDMFNIKQDNYTIDAFKLVKLRSTLGKFKNSE